MPLSAAKHRKAAEASAVRPASLTLITHGSIPLLRSHRSPRSCISSSGASPNAVMVTEIVPQFPRRIGSTIPAWNSQIKKPVKNTTARMNITLSSIESPPAAFYVGCSIIVIASEARYAGIFPYNSVRILRMPPGYRRIPADRRRCRPQGRDQ